MGVPRVWEKIMEKIKEGISRCGYMKRKLVTWAMSVSLEANQRLTEYINCLKVLNIIFRLLHSCYLDLSYVFMIIIFKSGIRRSHSSSVLRTAWSCKSFVPSWASPVVWSSFPELLLLEAKPFNSSSDSTFDCMKPTGWVKAQDPTLCLAQKCTAFKGKPSFLNLQVEYFQPEGQ